jgi:hypothetical protein
MVKTAFALALPANGRFKPSDAGAHMLPFHFNT